MKYAEGQCFRSYLSSGSTTYHLVVDSEVEETDETIKTYYIVNKHSASGELLAQNIAVLNRAFHETVEIGKLVPIDRSEAPSLEEPRGIAPPGGPS